MISNNDISALTAWLAEAGLTGTAENEVVHGFCERANAMGIPVSRSLVIIDTLHPVYEGRLFRWGHDPSQPSLVEYGRTVVPEGMVLGAEEERGAANWRASPFFYMLQNGLSLLRLTQEHVPVFPVMQDYVAAGMKGGVSIINSFAPAGVIGEMDAVYSSWMTAQPGGFTDEQLDALERLVRTLALTIKALALTRMTSTLMETYLGRDAARRVLSGRIIRGVADRIDAAIWFSDLRGFTRVTDSAPEQVIPLLNDYADAAVSAIHAHGGDVLKLIGDGILAIFTAEDRAQACAAALNCATDVRREVAALNARRAHDLLPVTDMYLGLHVGEVFYGNVGSRDRLDFTVVGPAVNEASRIAAMCRSVEQPVLVSQAFAAVDGMRGRLVSIGRYALRGVERPQELFTLEPKSAS
ncbi:adenylate/guanylate cyclase domain-containing protein [Pseudorhodoplanes sp.]|uniref:adenylate/guanylate cyclase domain-containing protein n=1 Tax=Pseudorhodoplanes sp. TaxID=1934341 RepID=UPI002B808B43|nr:adenylate/guanylate cyclase domain-containing protein [Pseudorhodoplanes sp.]HWV53258.1 adenylate/guanylate cyclase domain-containing protein [Pseudorhodoplanes sp.]